MQLQTIQNTDSFESIERFQSLSAGQYWRAVEVNEKHFVEVGDVLLVQSLGWVDDAIHTVKLRGHPLKLKVQGETFALRLHEFLAGFVHEPQAQSVRAQEMAQIQQNVSALQKELLDAQVDPQIINTHVQAVLIEQGVSPVAAPLLSAPANVQGAISTGITTQSIETLKQSAELELKIAQIKAQWLQSKTSDIAKTLDKLSPFFTEQAACAMASIEDVQSNVKKVMDGVQSLSLYVGTDVTVTPLLEGESADHTEPLTIMQRKLFVDRELSLWVDLDNEFDFQKEGVFLKALQDHPGFIEQMLPFKRSLCVMQMTDASIKYSDPRIEKYMNERNKETFLLVRDGERVFKVMSPVESHLNSHRLFPNASEGMSHFKGLDGSAIRFEDVAYSDKLEQHAAMALHYRRLLLLICGLDHREKLFGSFYPGESSMQFMSQSFQEQFMRFIHDDDQSMMLAGPEQRPSVYEWIAANNAMTQSGSRIVCNLRALMTPVTAPSACKEDRFSARGYTMQYRPNPMFQEHVVTRSGSDLIVAVHVRGETKASSYHDHPQEREFNANVKITMHDPDAYGGGMGLGYLCMDDIKLGDLDHYLYNRSARVNHVMYVRIFKMARAHLLAIAEKEKAPRALLLQSLIDGNVGDSTNRAALIDDSVRAWRAANRGAEIPAGPNEEGWNDLLTSMYKLGQTRFTNVQKILAHFENSGHEVLRIAVDGKSKTWVHLKPRAGEADIRTVPRAYVKRCMATVSVKGAVKISYEKWAQLSKRDASVNIMYESPSSHEWADIPTPFDSYEQNLSTLEHVDQFKSVFTDLKSIGEEKVDQIMVAYADAVDKNMKSGKHVTTLMAVPFALITQGKSYRILAVAVEEIFAFFYERAASDAVKDLIYDYYLKINKRTRYGYMSDEYRLSYRKTFEANFAEGFKYHLVPLSLKDLKKLKDNELFLNVDSSAYGGFAYFGERGNELLVNGKIKLNQEKLKDYYVADGIFDSEGNIVADDVIGAVMPQGYSPVSAFYMTFSGGSLDEGNKVEYKFVDLIAVPSPHVTKGRYSTEFPAYSEEMSASLKCSSRSMSTKMFFNMDVANAKWHEEGRVKQEDYSLTKPSPELPDPPEGVTRYWYVKK